MGSIFIFIFCSQYFPLIIVMIGEEDPNSSMSKKGFISSGRLIDFSDGLFSTEGGLAPSDAMLLEDEERNLHQLKVNNTMRSILTKYKESKVKEHVDSDDDEILALPQNIENEDEGGVWSNDASPSWLTYRPELKRFPVLQLHEEILEFTAWIEPTKAENAARGKVILQIESIIKKRFSSAIVEPFGSYYTGLNLPIGDIDLCIYNVPTTNKFKEVDILRGVALSLLNEGICSGMEVIDTARVPIIKFTHAQTGLSIDICYAQESGRDSSHYIMRQMERYPAIRPLVLVLKLWFFQRQLQETYKGGVGSYLLFVMVLGYLKNHPAFKKEHEVDTYARTNLGALLIGFFEFWMNFNYRTHALDVTDDFHVVTGKAQSGLCMAVDLRENPHFLAVRSPLDSGKDIGRNSYDIKRIRNAFSASFAQLAYALEQVESKGTILIPFCLCFDPLLKSRFQPCVLVDHDFSSGKSEKKSFEDDRGYTGIHKKLTYFAYPDEVSRVEMERRKNETLQGWDKEVDTVIRHDISEDIANEDGEVTTEPIVTIPQKSPSASKLDSASKEEDDGGKRFTLKRSASSRSIIASRERISQQVKMIGTQRPMGGSGNFPAGPSKQIVATYSDSDDDMELDFVTKFASKDRKSPTPKTNDSKRARVMNDNQNDDWDLECGLTTSINYKDDIVSRQQSKSGLAHISAAALAAAEEIAKRAEQEEVFDLDDDLLMDTWACDLGGEILSSSECESTNAKATTELILIPKNKTKESENYRRKHSSPSKGFQQERKNKNNSFKHSNDNVNTPEKHIHRASPSFPRGGRNNRHKSN